MQEKIDSPWNIKPGHFGVGPENIHIFENFIDTDDLKVIQDFCPTINEWNNSKESVYAEDGTCLYNADYWNDRQCSSEILEKISVVVFNIVDKYIKKNAIDVGGNLWLRTFTTPTSHYEVETWN